jgi:poly(hydroxyalkanoate) depolymerase family esterase
MPAANASLPCRIFVPSGSPGALLPLVVMLHGCKQSAEDFARGTRMEALAAEHGVAVAWPAQTARANRGRCWNWFRPQHQEAGAGEPAAIAAITRRVMERHPIDPARVYVAGLSAGGAMAVVLAATHPGLFAAVGVHSGLAYRAAHSVPSALLAMKGASSDVFFARQDSVRLTAPAIIFHGNADDMVHPRNGEALLAQWLASREWSTVEGSKLHQQSGEAGGRRYTRRFIDDGAGRPLLEHWAVEGLGHAWSGGDPAGSFTDPMGPDASREMLRFFLANARGPGA